MVEGNASMYLGSPRMAEMVIGEIATLEEMGGARMHATVSGCGDNLAVDDEDAIDQAQALLHLLPADLAGGAAGLRGRPSRPARSTADLVPAEEHAGLRHARASSTAWSTPSRSSRSSRCSPRS